MRRLPSWLCAAGAIVSAAALAGSAGATWTQPPLALASVDATLGAAGTLLRLTGTFPHDDLVQRPYLLHVFARELTNGTRFVCWSPGATMEGDVPEMAGVAVIGPEHMELIEAAESPSPQARIVALGNGRLDVILPPDFPSGPAEVLLWIWYEGVPVLSNPVPFVVEEPAPAW